MRLSVQSASRILAYFHRSSPPASPAPASTTANRSMSSTAPAGREGQSDAEFSAVYITAPDGTVAQSLAKGLVESRLVACVNLIPAVKSIYMWEGKLEESQEILLMAKTQTRKLDDVIRHVKANHPYQVPEVISVPIGQSHSAYLQWIRDSLSNDRR